MLTLSRTASRRRSGSELTGCGKVIAGHGVIGEVSFDSRKPILTTFCSRCWRWIVLHIDISDGSVVGRVVVEPMVGSSVQSLWVTVFVWSLAVTEARLAELFAHLCPDERRHSTRLRHPNARDAFVVGRGMTRELLARHISERPDAIKIVTGKSGKLDVLSRHNAIAFNVSHTGNFCALAVGNVESVGVDIETINPNIDDLTHSVFGRNEAAQFSELADARKTRAFFRAWVAKEAYLKATGQGLAGGLTALELDLTETAEIRAVAIQGHREALHDWSFHGFGVDDQTVGAIAARTAGMPLRVKTLRISAGDLTIDRAHQARPFNFGNVRSHGSGESS